MIKLEKLPIFYKDADLATKKDLKILRLENFAKDVCELLSSEKVTEFRKEISALIKAGIELHEKDDEKRRIEKALAVEELNSLPLKRKSWLQRWFK